MQRPENRAADVQAAPGAEKKDNVIKKARMDQNGKRCEGPFFDTS